MRKRFEIQLELGCPRIEDVEMPRKSRDELPPVMRALQEIYSNHDLNAQVFEILEKVIPITDQGRPGMNLWEIFVLGVVRLTLDANYDRLEHTANYDSLVREIMGVQAWGSRVKTYSLQSLKDNVKLITAEVIDEINGIVQSYGHSIKKKVLVLNLRVDSYPLESNVHFPTDYNLLWDAARKCIGYVDKIVDGTTIPGWRKRKYLFRGIKSGYRQLTRVSVGGGKNKRGRVVSAALDYLDTADKLAAKLSDSRADFEQAAHGSMIKFGYFLQLDYFTEMLIKHIDLVYRRIVRGEKIPHEEKMFSLFETYTEWISKGKSGNRIDLGLNIVLVNDQYGNILTHKILEKEHEVNTAVPLIQKVKELYGVEIDSVSFDKGFWSQDNYAKLSSMVKTVVMPKKGRLNQFEYAREHDKKFRLLKNKHSAVESDINCLEHHGLDRCPDRGIDHFRKYVSLGILSHTLHKFGNRLLEEDLKKRMKKEKRRSRKAA